MTVAGLLALLCTAVLTPLHARFAMVFISFASFAWASSLFSRPLSLALFSSSVFLFYLSSSPFLLFYLLSSLLLFFSDSPGDFRKITPRLPCRPLSLEQQDVRRDAPLQWPTAFRRRRQAARAVGDASFHVRKRREDAGAGAAKKRKRAVAGGGWRRRANTPTCCSPKWSGSRCAVYLRRYFGALLFHLMWFLFYPILARLFFFCFSFTFASSVSVFLRNSFFASTLLNCGCMCL